MGRGLGEELKFREKKQEDNAKKSYNLEIWYGSCFYGNVNFQLSDVESKENDVYIHLFF